MFLTNECDYAMRVVRVLSDLEQRTVKTICDCEHVPLHFAYKILKKLENAGIVSSRRGALGGYQLSRKLCDINLYDIVNAVDENLFINDCLQLDHECPHNNKVKSCNIHQELRRIQNILVDALKENTMNVLT